MCLNALVSWRCWARGYADGASEQLDDAPARGRFEKAPLGQTLLSTYGGYRSPLFAFSMVLM